MALLDQGCTADDEEMQSLNPPAELIGNGNVDARSSYGTGASVSGSNDIEAPPVRSGVKGNTGGGHTTPLWRVWPSKNTFCFNGFCITGGSSECWMPNMCVWSCILGPCTLFFYWVFPSMIRNGAYALPISVLVVFSITSGLLLATCCTDPGIIPRREVILATNCASDLEAALGYDVLGGSTNGAEPTLDPKLRNQGYRWCRTCRIVRPPRASHCSDCDNCVLRYDHHCPFVNNCVGQQNYHFFFGFITSVLVLSLLVIPSIMIFFGSLDPQESLTEMTKLNGSMWGLFYVLIALGVLIIIAALLSLTLWSYHVFLILRGKTTKEYLKSIPNVNEEPTLCAARGPALFNRWTMVDPADLVVSKEQVNPKKSHASRQYVG